MCRLQPRRILPKTIFFVHNNCIFSCNNSNYVEFNVDNVSKKWLIDTGASLSAVKYETVVALRVPIIRQNIRIKGIGGHLNTEGYVYINLSTNGMEIRHKFYVLRNLTCLHDGIIGQDFLQQYNCIVNYEENNMTLSCLDTNKKLTLPLGLGKIHGNNFITVPPRCEKIFYINTCMSEECLIRSKELCKGVYLAGGICKAVNGKIPIQILNSRDNEICLSYFSPDYESLSNYDICTYERDDNVNSERVRKMFSLLDLSHLNLEERRSIQNICAKFCDIFYLPGDKLTVSNIYEPEIKLKPNVSPSYIKPYRLPRSQREEISNQVTKLLSENIIEPSCSAWSSPVLLVPKKSDDNTKKWRLVIDYRKLNERIVDDKFPLPNIADILDSLSGSMYFTHLDLNQSYYQLNLKSGREYTAFTTHEGQYQLTRLPMGLKTSPSCFSRAMTIAMTGLNYEKCLIYLDDLLCFGRSLFIHNKNLIDIFSRLRKVNLKLNPSKCQFLKKDVLYLGHVVSAEGIKPDPEKTKAIDQYPVPQNSDEVRKFVAFTNYYRKFIPSFAEITLPLNKLCRKNVNFEWTEECQNAFLTLKQVLSSPKVLQYPNFDKDNTFILQTDASGFAIGAVLNNGDRRPVAFASRSLNKAEKNYPTIEKELLAITWAVKYFRPYLYGKKFIVETDHKPLIYLFNMTNPSSRCMKFRLILDEYDFDVIYVKGKDNVAADALSRMRISSEELKGMHENIISVMTRAQRKKLSDEDMKSDTILESNTPDDNWTDHPRVVEMIKLPKQYTEFLFLKENEWKKIKNDITYESHYFAYIKSKDLICVKPISQSQCTRGVFVRELSQFCTELNIKNVYFILNENNKVLMNKISNLIKQSPQWTGPRLHIVRGVKKVIDKDTIRVILNDYHVLPTSGHAGIRRMVSNIRRHYFWPGMEKDVTEFVTRCDQCQRQKHFKYTKQPMVITNTGKSAFDRVFLDLVGPISNDSNDYKYILTLQCDLSKYVEAYPITSKDSVTVATAFVNNFILRYGIPREIITDKGTEFISTIMQDVCKLLNISHLQSTAYHHQTIGALENSHKNLISYLRIMTNNNSENWSSWLPYWCFAFNTTIHTETKYSPYELVFGKRCNIPSNLTDRLDPLYNFENYPNELKYRLQKSQLEAKCNLENSKQLRKLCYDTYTNIVNYNQGNLILVKNEACKTKLDPLYLGPFEVIKDVDPNVLIKYNNLEKLVHKNRTKLYKL